MRLDPTQDSSIGKCHLLRMQALLRAPTVKLGDPVPDLEQAWENLNILETSLKHLGNILESHFGNMFEVSLIHF